MSKGNKHQLQYLVDCSSLYIFIFGCPQNIVYSKSINIHNIIHKTSHYKYIQNKIWRQNGHYERLLSYILFLKIDISNIFSQTPDKLKSNFSLR